ncbi:signal recognition particle 14-like protein [Phlyctochytrium arcticum]|nr:signal recognition particle 14-like protein [Phlyctochytrium arcticum]
MPLVSNDAFLSQLTKLYQNSKEKGTVYVTFKRYSHDKRKDAAKLNDPDTEFPCLVRAVSGSSKVSTLVQPSDTDRFHDAYTNVMVLHVTSLKKKERIKKVKKAKIAPTTVT